MDNPKLDLTSLFPDLDQRMSSAGVSRRALLKQRKLCHFCHRKPATLVEEGLMDEQLRFCSPSCLHRYKLEIFTTETMACLQGTQFDHLLSPPPSSSSTATTTTTNQSRSSSPPSTTTTKTTTKSISQATTMISASSASSTPTLNPKSENLHSPSSPLIMDTANKTDRHSQRNNSNNKSPTAAGVSSNHPVSNNKRVLRSSINAEVAGDEDGYVHDDLLDDGGGGFDSPPNNRRLLSVVGSGRIPTSHLVRSPPSSLTSVPQPYHLTTPDTTSLPFLLPPPNNRNNPSHPTLAAALASLPSVKLVEKKGALSSSAMFSGNHNKVSSGKPSAAQHRNQQKSSSGAATSIMTTTTTSKTKSGGSQHHHHRPHPPYALNKKFWEGKRAAAETGTLNSSIFTNSNHSREPGGILDTLSSASSSLSPPRQRSAPVNTLLQNLGQTSTIRHQNGAAAVGSWQLGLDSDSFEQSVKRCKEDGGEMMIRQSGVDRSFYEGIRPSRRTTPPRTPTKTAGLLNGGIIFCPFPIPIPIPIPIPVPFPVPVPSSPDRGQLDIIPSNKTTRSSSSSSTAASPPSNSFCTTTTTTQSATKHLPSSPATAATNNCNLPPPPPPSASFDIQLD